MNTVSFEFGPSTTKIYNHRSDSLNKEIQMNCWFGALNNLRTKISVSWDRPTFVRYSSFFFWILNTRVICIMISHMGGLRLFVLASFEASYNDWSRARNFVSYAMICSPFSCFVRICIGYGGWTHQDMCIRFKTEVYILGSPAVCLYMN